MDLIAVGSEEFVEKIQGKLGFRAQGRSVVAEEDGKSLRWPSISCNTLLKGEKDTLRPDNSCFRELSGKYLTSQKVLVSQ